MAAQTDRFELKRIGEAEWVICDSRFHPQDARCTVARIWEVDTNECQVVWLREEPLPTVYAAALDVLEDLCRTSQVTKPAPIPHFSPAERSPRHALHA